MVGSKQYEDFICEICPVRKPGYISPREQAEEQRQAFVLQLITALEDAEKARSSLDPLQLAKVAYNKLQFDYPIVSVQELGALNQALLSALKDRQGLRYLPTTKLVINILQGARSNPATTGSQGAAEQSAESVAYQHLAASYCIRYVHHVLALPVHEAQLHMDRVTAVPVDGTACSSSAVLPDLDRGSNLPAHQGLSHDALQQPADKTDAQSASGSNTPPEYHGVLAQLAGLGGPREGAPKEGAAARVTGARPGAAATDQTARGGEVFAAQQDDDGFEYEDFTTVAAVNGLTPTASTEVPAVTSRGWGNDATLEQRLVALGCAVDAESLASDDVWLETQLLSQVIDSLAAMSSGRLLGASVDQLAPLIGSWSSLAAHRMSVCQSSLQNNLPHLWRALGQLDVNVPAAAATLKQLPAQQLHSLIQSTSLITGLVKDSVRKQTLCMHLHHEFLPSLAVALDMLMSSKLPVTADATQLHMLQACCQITEFYALCTPNKGTGGSKLIQQGVLRALAHLFLKYGLDYDMEALRRSMLLVAALSAEVRSWVAQVPGLRDLVLGQVFQQHDMLEAHGLAWAALLDPESSGKAGLGERVQLLLQDTGAQQVQQVARALRLLSLAADVQQAGGPRAGVWKADDRLRLQQVARKLRHQLEQVADSHPDGQPHGMTAGSNVPEHHRACVDDGQACAAHATSSAEFSSTQSAGSRGTRAPATGTLAQSPQQDSKSGELTTPDDKLRTLQAACLKHVVLLTATQHGKAD